MCPIENRSCIYNTWNKNLVESIGEVYRKLENLLDPSYALQFVH